MPKASFPTSSAAPPVTAPALTTPPSSPRPATTPSTDARPAADRFQRARGPVIHNHLSLPHDRQFKQLPDDTQRLVLDRMKQHAQPDNPAARHSYAKLATNPDFGRLSPEHQRAMLTQLDKSPSARGLADDLGALARSPRFQGLNSGTGGEIIARMGADQGARNNVMSIANTEGFGQLAPTHQRELLQALDKRPRDVGHMVDLAGLASSPAFRNLGDGTKSEILAGMGRSAGDPARRQLLGGLATSPGFARLADHEKNAATRLVSSSGGAISDGARTELRALLDRPDFKTGTPEHQASELHKALSEQKFLPHAATAPDGFFDGKRAPYTVSAPTPMTGGGQRYDVTIEGKTYPVEIATTGAGLKQYGADDVAKALAAVPKRERETINKVILEGGTGPGYANSGKDGIIRMPASNAATLANDTFMASAFIHETGHIYTANKWDAAGPKPLDDPRWQGWKDAMAKDVVSPSKYAHTTPGVERTAGGGLGYADDFAEALLLYNRVKGTSEETEYRRLMPERFKVLDAM